MPERKRDITPERLIQENPEDDVECLCGARDTPDGFYAIDETVHEVEPFSTQQHENDYVCVCCGRVFNGETLEVVRNIDPAEFVFMGPDGGREGPEVGGVEL